MHRTMDIYDLWKIKELLAAHKIRLTKSLGQNFIISKDKAETLIDHADINSEDTVLEIGAGLLGLTSLISLRCKKIIAFEKDRRLTDLVQKEIGVPGNVTLLREDFLSCNLLSLAKSDTELKAIGNLPYSISSQVLFKIYENSKLFKSAAFLFQKELADRISSGPSSKNYGTISVISSLLADIKKGPLLGTDDFFPRPRIKSRAIRFDLKENPELKQRDVFDFGLFLKGVFSQRRKKILNSLKQYFKRSDPAISKALDDARIDHGIRIEKLAPHQIYILYRTLERFGLIVKSTKAKKI